MPNKIYCGIGSRNAPPDILETCTRLAERLDKLGYVLRSGGADGCDRAFEDGARHSMHGAKTCEIFVPWKGFNGRGYGHSGDICTIDTDPRLYELAELYHPKFNTLREPVKKLMARNGQQIFGEHLDDPVDFVICYTGDGCESHVTRTPVTGGTGQAISIASDNNIKVYNIKNKQSIISLQLMLDAL